MTPDPHAPSRPVRVAVPGGATATRDGAAA